MIHRITNQIGSLIRHPLTRDRPAAAIGRFIAWQLKSRLQVDVEFHWIDSSKLLVKRGMTGATGNIYFGLHECADMAFVLHFLRPGDLFGDVGANIGSYTVLASAVCGARSIAVEPDQHSAARLRTNVQLNEVGSLVEVIEAAVGGEEGVIQFSVGLDTMNKVSHPDDSGPSRPVPLTTLDKIFNFDTPALIKLDVEGFETEVLRGARQLLSNPKLLVVQSESRDAGVLRMLAENGFVESFYDPFQRSLVDKSVVAHSNALYIRGRAVIEARIRSARRFNVLHHSL